MKRVLSCILALVLLISMIPMSSITAYALDSKVEKAIEWAISIANDNTHGYSQANRTGPDYDCSSFVSTAFKKAGFSVSGSLHTGNMLNAFISAGFTKYNKGEVSLQRGDILLRPKTSSRGGHTELYIGNNQCVAAHSNKDGKTGDSSGQEIDVRSKNYCTFCKNSDYTYILRYEGSSSSNNYTYSFNFNANGGSLGSSGAFSVSYGEQFQVLNTTCTRSGYTWAGWNVKRNNDNKWYVDGQGWCTESQISSNGYIKKAYSNYKTLTLDDSWTSGIQGNCSYTFYAVWVQSRENKLKVFLSPYGEGYDHITALNNSSSSGFAQEHIYAWYVLYDGNTGALLNTYTDKNYSVELAIYDPNGDLVFNHTYTDSNDANWIGVTPQMSGTYTAIATISGDFTGSHSTTYQVSYDAELWASPESVSLNLNGTNSKTIAITPTGGYPGEKNATVNYNGSYVSVSSKWSNGQILVTLNGLKVGSTSIRVDLYENYTGNKNVVATITIPVTVTANTYTISYNANGGSGAPSPQIKYYGTNITLSSTIPTRSGYTFQGWATSSTATTATYQPGGTFSGNSNTTLYAVWKGNATSLSANSSNSAVISTGGEKKYFTFTPSQNGIYVIYSTGTSDTRVYLYDENGTQVNFNDDGGENRNFRLETVLAGGTKYTYAVGYYNSSTTGTINFNFGLIYSVSYNANGGENAPDSQVKDYGASLTLSSTEPTRSGYDFVGWATSSTATSATYQAGGTYTNNAHITLYAVWKVSDVSPWTECGENVLYKFYYNKGIVIVHAPTLNDMYENFYDFNGDSRIKQTDITAGSVSNYMFRDCVNLTTVNLSYVEKIGVYTFSGCTSLSTLNLSDELKTIGISAFRDCIALTEVALPDGLESIGALAFCGAGLSKVTIPESVTTIDTGAFDSDVVIYGYINSAAQTYAKQNGNQFVPINTGTLTANTSINVASILGGGYIQYYTYTPTVSGDYVIYSEGSGDSVVELYDIYGNELANDDNSGSNNNFRLEYKLTAGTKYLFSVKYKSSTETGTINVKLRNIYTVTYNANGGSNIPAAQNKEYGVDVTLSSLKPIRNGYTFVGWATTSTATSATYQAGSTFTSNANTTLYAVWQINPTLNVNSTNSAVISTSGEMKYYIFTPSTSATYVIYSTGSDDTRVYLYNSSGTELDNDDDDGDSSNFRLESDLTASTQYTFGIRYYNSSKTGTISFKFGNVYTVTYNANGGSGAPSSQEKDYGTDITLSSTIPTRNGYTFKGWDTSSTATSAEYQAGGVLSTDADTTLYAIWESVKYTISYNANGGSGAPSDQSKTYGVNLTLSSTKPTRSGYTFIGWSTSSTATIATYQPNDAFATNANTTLYAVWEKDIILSSISVSNMPTKTIYYIGDSLNTSGLKLTLTYDNYTTETITSGFTTSGFSSITAGIKSVTISYGGKTTMLNVTVNTPSILISKTSASLKEGETTILTATTTPSDQTVTWTSSDTSVAAVSNGTVTAKGVGTAEITAKFTYNGIEYRETCTVVVETTVLLGDVNGDGAIDAGDAVLISRYDAGFITLTADQLEAGDVNGDGAVDAGDAVVISRYDAGFISSLN